MRLMHPVQKLYQTRLKQCFPSVRFAFAYGSGVFTQHGRAKGKMLDMIFAVDDSEHWHNENLKMNWSHYSSVRRFGSGSIAYVQRCPAGVYYNTLIEIDNQLIKYGVIEMSDLLEDLQTWKWLYISGRLHKPVLLLTEVKDAALLNALTTNLRNSARCGLTLIKQDQCSEEELYCSITSLSYQGDFRMYFGEDKNKVSNIVKPNLAAFRSLYRPYLEDIGMYPDKGVINKVKAYPLLEDELPYFLATRIRQGASLQTGLASIVRKSSIQQSAKGIITAGLNKSLEYSFDKISKMLSSSKLNK